MHDKYEARDEGALLPKCHNFLRFRCRFQKGVATLMPMMVSNAKAAPKCYNYAVGDEGKSPPASWMMEKSMMLMSPVNAVM
jgi:hypothetical protein